MFRSRVFASPDAFHVALEYGHNETPGHSSSSCSSKEKVRLPVSSARLELDWSSAEPEQQVVERFVRLQSRLLQQHTHERVALHLDVEPIPNAATFPHQSLTVRLAVACSPPVLRSIHFTRTSGSGNASETLVSALLAHTALDGVWKLRGCEGLGHFWATCVQAPGDWRSLKSLNLSSCGLGVLPAAVGQLGGLRVLRLNHNKLVSLTPELGLLTELEVLSANHNQLVTLPAELRRCCRLRELHLEHNRLVTPLLDLTHATCLASLQLYGNPLDYLPELGPALGLRSLSLANVRILADAAYSRWEVEVTAASSSYTSMVIGARSHKLQPLFNLVFRRSNIQHPLLMGALSRLVEEPGNLQLLVREDVALQQLVLAALGSSSLVVGQAVKVMAAAGSYAGAARRLVRHNVVQAITDLVASQDVSLQLSGLSVLSSLSAGAAEGEVAGEVLVPTQLLDRLLALIRQHNTHEQVRCAALHALGNSAFDAHNRRRYLQSPGLMQLLVGLAAPAQAGADDAADAAGPADAAAAAAAVGSSEPGTMQLKQGQQDLDCSGQLEREGAAADDAGMGPRVSLPRSLLLSGHQQPDSTSSRGSTPSPQPPPTAAAGGALQPTVQQDGAAAGSVRALSPPAAAAGSVRALSLPAAAAASASPPTLSMSRNMSFRPSTEGDAAAATAELESLPAAGRADAIAGPCAGPGDDVIAPSASGSAAAAVRDMAAAGLTAIAEAATAATGFALAAATTTAAAAAAGAATAEDDAAGRGSSSSGSSVSITAVPPSGALAVAAGAAAAAAAAPQAAPVAGSSGAAAAAATVAAAGEAVFPKRRRLVRVDDPVKLQAIRLLAVLGQNEQVRIALGDPPIRGRGLRVLAMDGGGMKGLALVELLRQLQRRAGAPIWSLFDVIGGTSTGGLLAVATGILRLELDECQDIYTKLGNKVFHSSVSQEEAGWKESLYRMYATGSASMRVAVYGAKHDAAPYEELLRQACAVQQLGCASDRLIDTAVLGGPKVFVVATLASERPAAPFAFRNYELPEEAAPAAAALAACGGSCKHHVWEAVRASSAAPYYLDDFLTPDGKRFQDGATTANNPAVVALAQARLLHPQLPIDVLVSLGCGAEPPAERSKGLSSVIDTGSVLLESACSVDRVHEALAATLPLVPGCQYYRFNPIDARCAMELDDIKPESWRKLTAATSEYCSQPAIAAQFEQLAQLLTAHQGPAADQQAAGAGVGQAGGRRHVQQQQWHRQQQQQQQTVGAARDRQMAAPLGAAAGSFSSLGSIGSLGLSVDRSGAAHQQQDRPTWQGTAGIPAAPLGFTTSLKRQRAAAAAAGDAEQEPPGAQAGLTAAAAAAGGSSSIAGVAAPKLLYQKGVLLVEAQRGVAAAATAAATAAGAAALSCVRQQQQQELVGRMLAAALPQRFLQVCDLSSAAVHDSMHSSQPPSRPSSGQPRQQQQQAAALQHAEELRNMHSPGAGDSAAKAAEGQQQQQDSLAGPARLAQVNSRPAERRNSYAASSPAAAAASPKTQGSWLGYLFPWQAASGSEQQDGAAGGAGDRRSSETGEGVAIEGGTGAGAARAVGAIHASLSDSALQSTAAAAAAAAAAARHSQQHSPGTVPLSSQQQQQQQQHYSKMNQQQLLSAAGVSLRTKDRSRSPAPRSPLSRSYQQQQQQQQQQQLAAAAAAGGGDAPRVTVDWPGSSSKSSGTVAGELVSSANDAAAGAAGVASALRAALSGAAGRIGVLHLALHSTQWGLVGAWRQQITAVVEPGAAAAELLSFLGLDPSSSSLGQLVASQGPLLPTPDGGMLAVLGQQQVLAPAPMIQQQQQQQPALWSNGNTGAGWNMPPPQQQQQQVFGGGISSAFLTSWVLQLTQPDAQRLLGVQELYPLLSQLQQLVVVSSSWLPHGVTEVLLRGGVAAVVAAADAAALDGLEAADVAEFFRVFYEGLVQAGLDVLQALQSAAAAVPAVGPGVYECYQL